MSDEADLANDQVEKALAQSIRQIAAGVERIPYTGRCHNCGADLYNHEKQRRWCDDDCRDDWQLRKDRGVQ